MSENVLRFLTISAAAGALAACAGAPDRNPGPCPVAGVLEDAARQIVFAGPETLDYVAYTAEIQDVSATCRYWADRPIDVDMELTIAFGRGPAGFARRQDFEYFVSVTVADRIVVSKQIMPVSVRFDRDGIIEETYKIENLTIPRARETTSGDNFEILVGMNLTPAQLAFNRSGRSLRFPEMQPQL
ncbi:MAG: hypothetical protein Tsb0010_16930 [Parvularculaceae bacterium]